MARKKKHVKIKSKAQAGLFGAVASGKSTKAKGLSPKQAKKNLKGLNVKKLPARIGKRKKR